MPTSVAPLDWLSYFADCSEVTPSTPSTVHLMLISARVTTARIAFSLSDFKMILTWPIHWMAWTIRLTTN